MNLSFSRTALSVVVATSLSQPVWANASNLDQVIVSATRVEQAKSDYTGNITVITSEQLTEKAIQTLPEALDRLAGIPAYSNGGLGTTTSVFLRGHDSKRLLLVVDGMRFNDPSGISGPQWQHLLVSDIERIEILPGAQAGIWGADAAAGVINVITKKAAQGTHGSIAYTLGDLGQKQTQGTIGYANKNFDARIGYTGLSSDEFSSITPIVNGVKQNPLAYEKDGYRNDTLNAKMGWNIAHNQRLEISAFKADSRGFFDGTSRADVNAANVSTYQQQTLGATYSFAIADWKIALNAQQGNIDRSFIYPTRISYFDAKTNQQSITANRKDSLGGWTFGVDTSEQQSDNIATGKKQRQQGVFVARIQSFHLPQAEHPTIVNLSLRNDDFNDYNSYFGKRLGIKQMMSKDAYFAMNMADSRRMPNLSERYYDGINGTRTDAGSLRPETVESKEVSLGWKGYSLARFEDKVTDLIEYNRTSQNYSNIAGVSELKGWEWKASESLPSISSEISASYTVLDAKTQTGTPLARRPETSGSLGWTYLGLNKTLLGVQTQFVGTRLDYTTTPTATQLNPDTGNYWLWHANASYQLNKEVRLFTKAINLTDERIAQAYGNNATATATYYAYSPRTFLAGVEYKF